MESPADAPQPRRIVWKKVGAAALPPDIYDDQRGRLYFYRVDDIHAGDYECGTTNPETDAKAVASLKIETISYQVTVSAGKLTLKPGESGEIICTSTPESRNLEWLPVNQERLPQGVYSRGGRLIVRGATPSHAGLYSCSAGTFGAGEARAEIVIDDGQGGAGPITLTLTPSKLSIKPGGSSELICRAEGSTQRVEWVAVGKDRLPDGVYDAGDGRLIFQNANSQQSGLYSCNAGILGAGEQRAEVVVNEKPDVGNREGIIPSFSYILVSKTLNKQIIVNRLNSPSLSNLRERGIFLIAAESQSCML